MKNSFLKTVASVVVATTLLFTTATCFAEVNANTVATYYESGKVQVTSIITDVPSDQMVTYLATKENTDNPTEDEIVYITQWTSDGSEKKVSYTVDDPDTVALVRYGSDDETTADALNEAEGENSGVSGEEQVVTLYNVDKLENVTVTVGGNEVTSCGIVANISDASSVDEYGIYVVDANGVPFKFGDEDTKGGFYEAAQANEDGYFAVNIASDDIADYNVYSYYKIGNYTYINDDLE